MKNSFRKIDLLGFSFSIGLVGLFVLLIGLPQSLDAAPPSPPTAYAVQFVAPNANQLSEKARNAIIRAVNNWNGSPPEDNTFFLINLRYEGDWALATLTYANLDAPLAPGDESHLNPNNMFALVLVQTSGAWKAAIESDIQAQELLSLISDTKLNPAAKQAMFPNPLIIRPDSPQQQYNNYKFPWRANQPWRTTQGWHDTYTGYGFPANYSLDFDIRTDSNADIVAAASGTVTLVCNGTKEKLLVITTDGTSEKLGYLHLDKGSVEGEGIQQGTHVDQNRKLGRMWETPPSGDSDGCGTSYGTHLHVYFPEKPFSIDGKTFSQDNVHSGEDLYSSQGGSSGGPPGYAFCANENQRCNFSGTKDVAYGANGSFKYKDNISGGIDCNNSTFGDPIPGVGKACYTKDSSQTGCTPNSDQVALFEHGGYGGNCKVFGKRDYPNPGEMGFANDTASSIKVGGNVKATLCKDDNYGGGCEDFSGDDGNLGDNSIGDNQVSSLKVQDRGGQTGCTPNSDQVALFEHGGYGGNCKVFGKRDYPNPGEMGFANDTASSIKVGGNVKATLCKDDNYGGGCEDFSGDDGNLGDNSIGDNQVSSLKVQDRGSSGGNGVEFCDGTNYGSPCITLTAGKYGNLNDIGWYDRIESLRFKGNYVGNYHVVLSTETNHGGTPGHYERDEANVPDPWRNRTRSIEINYIDRNNPPGTPALASPGDWYESNDGTAPNLCWNASSDPEGDNPVQYYAEVFDSAVNGNSGWTTNTCWRPSSLDNQYFGYQWRVKARDNKNKESGWSETRHFTIRQPAPQKPDLRPATLSGYPAPLVPSSIQGTHQTNILFANARTFIDWHFTNAGNGVASGNFYVDVYFDDQRVVHYPYADYGAGGTGGFDDWAAMFNATGVHKLKIVTDPENAVQESDENNNVWEQQFTWVAINGWRGEYFKNATLDSNPWLTRDDANIDFDWAGGSPDPSLPVDNFSARWTRTAAFECGRYRFNVHVDDGARLWVNNQKILDEWRDQVANFYPEVDLPAGTLPIQVEYYEGGGGAAIQVSWQKLSSCVTKPSAPHDPNPANGASLSYRTELDVSVQGEGDKFIFHVWGNNYDRWSDWTSSRSFHLDGLTNQTYNFQAQARNSAGDSPWSAVWTFTIQPAPSQQLVLNPGFEADDDGNGIPDNWGNNVKFMRVGAPRRSDSYAGRLSATDNKNVTITQQISNLAAGQTYNASCWVRIKKTADVFTFKVQIRWLDASNKAIRVNTLRTFTGKTVGWEQVATNMVAPTGATAARLQFKATSLNAKIYLDDCSFTP